MSERMQRKSKIRKLVREMQAPQSLSGFRQAAREDEEMPTSLTSPLAAGRPVGERIAELPAALRAPAEKMIKDLLDLLADTTEEKGMGGAEAIARGVTQGLKSRGMQLGMTEGTTPVVPRDEHKEKVEKHLADIKKNVPGMRKADEEKVRGELHALMQQSDKQFGGGKKMSESALRGEIRQALIEEGFFDDVKGAAAQAAGAALEAGTKMLLKKVVQKITGQTLPDNKADELEALIKHVAPALLSQSGDAFRTMLQKLGATTLGKAAERGAEKMKPQAEGEVKKEGARRGRKNQAVNEISDWARDSFDAVAQAGRKAGATQAELDAVESALPELESLVRELAMATDAGDVRKAMEIMVRIETLGKSITAGQRR